MKVEIPDQECQYVVESNKLNRSSIPTVSLGTKQSKTSKHHLFYIMIIICTIIIAYALHRRQMTQICDNNQERSKLQKQLIDLKDKNNKNIVQINSLHKQITLLNKKLTQDRKNIKQHSASQYHISESQAYINSVSTIQTIGKNKEKNEYITPALEAISSPRKFEGGIKKAVNGTTRRFEYLQKNSDGKTIEEVLYDQISIEGRKAFHNQRVEFLSKKKNMESFYLATFNNKINYSRDEQEKKVEEEEYKRINQIWDFQKYQNELPMCVIVPSYNNNARFRIEYNLNSIFQQNYTNYYVVIINDASTDGSDQLYRKYLDFYKIDKSTYSYIENPSRLTALQNHYQAVHKYCSPDSIGINLDGDDQFIGKNVLKVFNAAYQKQQAGVIWSNFYLYDQGATTLLGFTQSYSQNEKKMNSYRISPQRFSHLRSFRCQLFLKIDKDIYFTDQNGNYFRSTADIVMMLPLLELSCGRNTKIQGYHYLYNINTGLNDYQVDRQMQAKVDQISRKKPVLNCSKQFDQKMIKR